MEPDNHSAAKPNPGRKLGEFLIGLVVFILLYALSFGPVDRFYGVLSPGVMTVYAPLMWTYKKVRPFQIVFDKYMVLWDENW